MNEGLVTATISPCAADCGRVPAIGVVRVCCVDFIVQSHFVSQNNLIESDVSHSSLARCLTLVKSVVHLTEQSRAGIRTWDLKHYLYINLRKRLRPLGHHSRYSIR